MRLAEENDPELGSTGRRRMAEHFAEEPVGQMPPVPDPHPFDEVVVHELTTHRINPIPKAAVERAAPGPGIPSGFLEQRLQIQAL